MTSSGETKKGTARHCLVCGHEAPAGVDLCPNDGTRLCAADPMIGATIDKYQVIELLGRGGMSTVYKARHVSVDRLVAVKLLRADLVHDPKMLQRFQLEAKAVSKLKHPNIMTVHDFGLTREGVPYMAMDLLEGKTMYELLEFDGQFTPARCVNLFLPICDALGHAHENGIVHRDIKPSNIMINIENGEEHPKLVDFGIAKMLAGANPSVPSVTATGEIFGSPLYMAPEQFKAKPVDARTDIYALGCVVYEALTGWPALQGQTVMDTMSKHLSEMPLDFQTIRPDIGLSKQLEDLVFKAIQKDPAQRFQSMGEFANALSVCGGPTVRRPTQATVEHRVFDNGSSISMSLPPDAVSPPVSHVESYDTPTSAKPDAFVEEKPSTAIPRIVPDQYAPPPSPSSYQSAANGELRRGQHVSARDQYVPLPISAMQKLPIRESEARGTKVPINRTVIIAIITFIICLLGTMFLINLANGR